MIHEYEMSLAIAAYHADLAARDEPIAIAWEQLDSREQTRYRAIAMAVIAASGDRASKPQLLNTVKQVIAMTGYDRAGEQVAVCICMATEIEPTVAMLLATYPEITTVKHFEIELRSRPKMGLYIRTESGFEKI